MYIDGGEISIFGDDGTPLSLPANATYSINISESWTNHTVVVNQIEKIAPTLVRSNLWSDKTKNVFYSYNGEISGAWLSYDRPDPPPSQLWMFTPSADLGQWSEVLIAVRSDVVGTFHLRRRNLLRVGWRRKLDDLDRNRVQRRQRPCGPVK